MKSVSVFAYLFLCLFVQKVSALEIYAEVNPPSVYRLKSGELQGYLQAYVEQIALKTGTDAQFRALPWNRAFETTLIKPETALFPTARTKEREDQFKWVGPIGVSFWSFFKKKDLPLTIETLEDAKGSSGIGVILGSAIENHLRKRDFQNISPTHSRDLILRMVLKDRISLMASSQEVIDNLLTRAVLPEDTLVPVYNFRACYLYIAFNKNTDNAVIRQWQDALDRFKTSGEMERTRALYSPSFNREKNVAFRYLSDLSSNGLGCES
ncbi:substrate-binding periplasmic protein [Kiloniella sp. b19]|uniref:substrate-binding periplasmic protein n=1 Tax=Kiloniella sp. GXU_MW_B19 TaxID=3141326 RepID=UPI0031E09C7F